MGKKSTVGLFFCLCAILFQFTEAKAQCTSGDILDPGFKFLTNSRGCAPFTVQMQTEYLSSTPGTTYYVDWGDGTAEEVYFQTTADGVILQHTYPNSPVECGYDVIIDASNTCNPRGSVTPIETQVIIWTNDVISINPQVFRVCQGFAQTLQFTDDSDWNCFPRDTRENEEARWIQWMYGTGDPTIRIPGIGISGDNSLNYLYKDPDPSHNPYYPVMAPGMQSLSIQVPVTAAGDVGKEFEITLKNWNQCNPYDNDVKDGDPRNPVSGDYINGDNPPMVTEARIVIVPSPEPDFQTRADGEAGSLQTNFCIGDNIYFENLTPEISGASLVYEWEFYNDPTGSGDPVHTAAVANPFYAYQEAGEKLVRLNVRDNNAAGNCEEVIEKTIFISPFLQARIGVTDLKDVEIVPEFCQTTDISEVFNVRFHDESFGTVTSDIRWRWEFYDEEGNIITSYPESGNYSPDMLGPYDKIYQAPGRYKVKLIVLDEVTGCASSDSIYVNVNLSPSANFNTTVACFGNATTIEDISTSPEDVNIIAWDYDIYNDGTIDTTFYTSATWNYIFDQEGIIPLKLTVTSSEGCVDSVVKNLEIQPLPQTLISADKLKGCSELVVNLQNESWDQTIPVQYYQWEIDSGNGFEADSVQNPGTTGFDGSYKRIFINKAAEDKLYTVRLKAKSADGCISYSNTVQIIVTPGAKSGFLYTNYSPFNNNCSPQEVNFAVDAATKKLSPSDYSWTIMVGDSLVYIESTSATPSFDYVFQNSTLSAVQFAVTLTTSLTSSCSSDSSVFVKINPAPIADFNIDTLNIDCDRVDLEFSSTQKGLSQYRWRLRANDVLIYSSDGNSDSFSYIFDRAPEPVNLDISLSTTNLANCDSEEVVKNTSVPAKNNFTASFVLSAEQVSLPDAVVGITNTSTEGNWEYFWNFGNGETSADPEISAYTYTETGDYTITLTLTDGACTTTYSEHVTVISPPPTADFIYDPSIGCLPLMVTFTNLSTHGNNYEWDFGDGNTSTLENPSHTYTEAGIYSVTLTTYGNSGVKSIEHKVDIIEVLAGPVAYFEVRPDLVYLPDMPVYTRNLTTGATSYYWDFGDGTVSNEFEPQHLYEHAGQYDVTLMAYNDHCHDSLTIRGAVTAKVVGRVLVPNAFSPSTSGPASVDVGENDVFVPLMADVAEFHLQIFNRWGELLFEGFDQGWDGYYQGQLCAQDVYVYKLEVVFNSGEKATKIGDVNLIR